MVIIKLIRKMYTPSHTQRQPTLVVFEQPSSVQVWGSALKRRSLSSPFPCLNPTWTPAPWWSVSVWCEASGN